VTDTDLRVFVYDHLVATGRAPSLTEIGQALGSDPADARARLAAMRIGKTILPHPTTGELWMAGPFSAVPTTSTVSDGVTTWWANCIWDMFGVAVIVGHKLTGRTICGDCGETLTIDCDPVASPAPSDAIAHFLLPAREWYVDVGYT
jgi:hypothetical protein